MCSSDLRYSFLLAMPAVFGSGLYEVYKVVKEPCTKAAAAATHCTPELYSAGDTLAATVVAFVVGLVVIAFFLRYLNGGSFMPFVAYRIVLGLLVIGLLMTGVVKP